MAVGNSRDDNFAPGPAPTMVVKSGGQEPASPRAPEHSCTPEPLLQGKYSGSWCLLDLASSVRLGEIVAMRVTVHVPIALRSPNKSGGPRSILTFYSMDTYTPRSTTIVFITDISELVGSYLLSYTPSTPNTLGASGIKLPRAYLKISFLLTQN